MELPVDEAPVGGFARNAELVDNSDRCSAAVHGLTGEAGLALFDAQAEGYGAMAPLLAATFEGFGAAVVGHTETLAAFDGTADGVEGYVQALDALDEVTLDECGFPGGAAMFTMLGAMALNSFSCVSVAIGDEDDECEEPAQVFPDVLPCFDPLGGSWVDLVGGGNVPWEVVDCATGVPVRWDHAAAAWLEYEPLDAFEEISDTIGD